MHTFHIATTSVAFALFILQWQRTRDSGEFGFKENWPLIAFAAALILSLPSSFISLFQEHKEVVDLVKPELIRLSAASLGVSILAICSTTIKKVTDVGAALLFLLALGIAFFLFTATHLAKMMDERWTQKEAQSAPHQSTPLSPD